MNSLTLSNRNRNARGGFTLVELLVTLAILGILGAAVMFAMAGATEAARRAKTKTLIASLHTLLMERYESYQTRRVPIDTAGMDPGAAAALRLQAIRELMRMEMPDTWNDINAASHPDINLSAAVPRTALSNAYLRRRNTILTGPNPPDLATLKREEGAECLYMIITMATGDGEARSHFADSSIGDVDGDGAPEFLDGWGKPIRFLRWPAGFISELQPMVGGVRDAESDHDPFDPLKVHSGLHPTTVAYRLVPLIFSAGPDEFFDILSGLDDPGWIPPLDPYEGISGSDQRGLARDGNADEDEQWHDNIHNHLIGTR